MDRYIQEAAAHHAAQQRRLAEEAAAAEAEKLARVESAQMDREDAEDALAARRLASDNRVSRASACFRI